MAPGVYLTAGDPKCRSCGCPVSREDVFCDLGMQPLANALLTSEQLQRPQICYPTRVLVCRSCLLVQLPKTEAVPAADDLFPGGYPFYSGQAVTWMAHCRDYADYIIDRLKLGPLSRVIEIGSNDGTMLARFRGKGIPALGIEPSEQLAEFAQMDGFATICAFWTERFARQLRARRKSQGVDDGGADLVIANNVLAHVPDLIDFLEGVRATLKLGGVATFEVPYIAHLIHDGTFDQVYHEHHCYFSMQSLDRALRKAGLHGFDVTPLPTHGGSLRVYACDASRDIGGPRPNGWDAAVAAETRSDLGDLDTYLAFASRPGQIKLDALYALASLLPVDEILRIVGYGASAKASTLLNYLGLGPECIQAMVDVTPAKQGKYVPGVAIPIHGESWLEKNPADVVINFCWNWQAESEQRIRSICPDAQILYLNPTTDREVSCLDTAEQS